MYSTIRQLLQSVVPDLQGLNAHRYRGNITGGIQEFMEAVLFQHYLETQRLMSFEDAGKQLPDGVVLTYEDYLLGVFDMTGELMRFAITYMATHGQLPGDDATTGSQGERSSILTDMQSLRSELEGIDAGGSYGLSKEFSQKLKTTRNSIEKVENGVYSMIVRGKERPKGWRPDTSLADAPREAEQIESY
jgi:predicted translin family RNA/ssDNA-binding protein